MDLTPFHLVVQCGTVQYFLHFQYKMDPISQTEPYHFEPPVGCRSIEKMEKWNGTVRSVETHVLAEGHCNKRKQLYFSFPHVVFSQTLNALHI